MTGVKLVESYDPYGEFCPHCQTNVVTRVNLERGTCWWIVFCIGCFLFWPICYWLCCESSKDAQHMCPTCNTVLAVKKGGC